jgi:hypothetical protein
VIPTFAGLFSAGLYQINLTVPTGLGTGDFSSGLSHTPLQLNDYRHQIPPCDQAGREPISRLL